MTTAPAADRSPQMVILAGPNGAGKSTAAPNLLPDSLDLARYLNADTIARGLSAFDPAAEAVAAGRILLAQMADYIADRVDFAIETTMSGRSLAKRAADAKAAGYEVRLFFLYVPSPEFSVGRVARRVSAGGHHIPTDTIRRRHDAALRNFFQLYRPLADDWTLYDNTDPPPVPVATGRGSMPPTVLQPALYDDLTQRYA